MSIPREQIVRKRYAVPINRQSHLHDRVAAFFLASAFLSKIVFRIYLEIVISYIVVNQACVPVVLLRYPLMQKSLKVSAECII